MRYLLMLHADEQAGAAIPPDEMAGYMKLMSDYQHELEAAGAFVSTAALMPSSGACCVTRREGKTLATDGPFTEAKEAFGGYFIIKADTADEAQTWAARCPAATWGTVEIRQIRDPGSY